MVFNIKRFFKIYCDKIKYEVTYIYKIRHNITFRESFALGLTIVYKYLNIRELTVK